MIRKPTSRRWIGIALAAALAATAAALISWRHALDEARQPVDLSGVEYVGSARCVPCHEFRHETWSRTYHSRMTQEAGPRAVLGDFENAAYTYGGVTSRFTREGSRYFIETLDAVNPSGGGRTRYEVVMTVGSRRLQQYVTRIGDRHFRLPLAWNVEEGRWFHLAGGFLHPDGADFHNHTSLWDANCIFCHNVKAQPRLDPRSDVFDARVAELGIACEACHGPGAEHVRRARRPLVSAVYRFTGLDDPTAVSPYELTPERLAQLCGHCHGQRLPDPRDRIREFLTSGDPYTAGDDLNRFTKPIRAHTELEGVELSLRFWNDGTPRLSAYEYQSLLMTPDYQKGGLTCTHCHSMHGGDPRGMLADEMRGPAACAPCHADITENVAGHALHAPDGPGGDCYACHMPRITYGVLEAHPTHRIRVPDPSRAWRFDMPEACTLCHTNRTAEWAANALAERRRRPVRLAPDGDFRDVAECVRALLAGDVVQRAVAARALASSPPWAVPFLLLTMEDNYPAIRHFAVRGLRVLLEREGLTAPDVPRFDPLGHPSDRAAVLGLWWDWWRALDKSGVAHPGPAVPLDAGLLPDERTVARLKANRDERIIAIGE